MSIHLSLLGNARCQIDGRELAELPTQRTRFALLAYLAIERNVARDSIAAMFWPDSDDERARHALSQSLYELKKFLGDDWVSTQSGRLVVAAHVTTDAARFIELLDQHLLDEALSIYAGSFLTGYILPNALAFEQWLDLKRAYYERAHRKARRDHLGILIAQNQLGEATAAARQWVEYDPLEDEANHKLIELLAAGGSRSAALSAYQVYEQRLRSELDIVPLDETRDLVQRIRASTGGDHADGPRVTALPALPPSKKQVAAEERWRSRGGLRRVGLLVGAIITVLALFVDVWSIVTEGSVRIAPRWVSTPDDSTVPDSSRIVVFPFEYDASVDTILNEQNVLHDALSRWTGHSVVDAFQVQAAIRQLETQLRPRDAIRIARRLGAGLYIVGSVSTAGADSLRVHAAIYDASRDGDELDDETVRVHRDLKDVDGAFTRLADALVFGSGETVKAASMSIETHSAPARRAFAASSEAIRQWDLALADSNLLAAIRHDQNYTQAYLWLAQVRAWQLRPVVEWKYAVDNVNLALERLSARDRQLAEALTARARRDFMTACNVYRELTKTAEKDFVAWFGLADCLNRDSAVLPDPKSPSGFAFRSSFREATTAYERAFVLMPSVFRAFRSAGFDRLRVMLFTNPTQLRGGSGPPNDTGIYIAYPGWHDDTLAFYPRPIAQVEGASAWARAHGLDRALNEQRMVLLGLTQAWRAAYPRDADAKHAVAIALELLGDPGSLDTLRDARSLTKDREESLRLAASEVWLRLKFSVPHDRRGLRKAAAIADSIIRDPASRVALGPSMLAALAALRGKAALAAELYRKDVTPEPFTLAPARAADAQSLLVYASFGGPRDSLIILDERLSALSDQNLGDENDWYTFAQRARAVAFADYRLVLPGVPVDFALSAAQLAGGAGNKSAVDAWLRERRQERASVPAKDLAIEILLPETRLISTVYGPAAAAAWIDPHLKALRWTPPLILADVPRSVSVVRSFAFRAELAVATGDLKTARDWAACALILWNNADDFLQPTVARARALVTARDRK